MGIHADQSNRAVYLKAPNGIMLLGGKEEFGSDILNRTLWNQEKFEKDGLIFSTLLSDTSSMEYIIVEQYGDIYQELQMVHLMILVSAVVSIGVGLFFSFYLTRKNYIPMEELITSVADNTDGKIEKKEDEYSFLSRMMKTALESRGEVEKQLEIIRLLRGYSVPEKKEDYFPHFPVYATIVFAIEDAKAFFNGEDLAPDSYRLLSFIVENCSGDFFPDAAGILGPIEMDRYMVVILGYRELPEEILREKMKIHLDNMHRFFNESLGIRLSVSLGRLCRNLRDLAASYERAREALECRIIMGNNVVIDSRQIMDVSLFYEYSLENEKDIINSLKNGNFKQAKEYMFRVIDRNLASGRMSSQMARCMLFDLIGTVIKALSQTHLDNHFVSQLNPIEKLFQCETFEQMKKEIEDILEKVCEYVNENREDPNKKLFDRIAMYVEENYMDVNLNVSALTERLYVSKTFLVKLFRDYGETTPLDFINRIRCERAVDFLKKTDITVEEIAFRVGYTNAHSFIRVFKKFYGMPPGAYRTEFCVKEEKKG